MLLNHVVLSKKKTYLLKNTTKPWISGEIWANVKAKNIIHFFDLEILSQIKLGKQK